MNETRKGTESNVPVAWLADSGQVFRSKAAAVHINLGKEPMPLYAAPPARLEAGQEWEGYPGIAHDLEMMRNALREATAIGIANMFAYCGAYVSLTPYKQKQWDRLGELAKLAAPQPNVAGQDATAESPRGTALEAQKVAQSGDCRATSVPTEGDKAACPAAPSEALKLAQENAHWNSDRGKLAREVLRLTDDLATVQKAYMGAREERKEAERQLYVNCGGWRLAPDGEGTPSSTHIPKIEQHHSHEHAFHTIHEGDFYEYRVTVPPFVPPTRTSSQKERP